MRYVCMHKASEQDEAGLPPPPELIAGMGQLIGETAQAGRFLAGEGLRPSSTRHRLTFAGGACKVTPGPLRGENELPERLLILKVRSADEAVDWARRYGSAVGATRLELGPLTEEWDLGLAPRPTGAVPQRFMILHMASADAEAGVPPSARQARDLHAMLAEMERAGVLLFSAALASSAKGMRLRYRDGRRTRIDGPFTESKELIGGFCMVEMESLDEIAAWTDRFARILGGTVEVDVRVVDDVHVVAEAPREAGPQ